MIGLLLINQISKIYTATIISGTRKSLHTKK